MAEIGIKFDEEQGYYKKLWKAKENEHYLVTIRDNNYQKEYTVRLSDLESVEEKLIIANLRVKKS
ncbi:MAG: hypothetical protein L0L90_08020 [Lactococcus lactis]|nr:hypothetical protein [Lactococcus lactis]MDN6120322.1 hypothetical protein [Lactococcus lactis]MDN6505435.1 hypothetical protein [Lactococcus lactis]MDN6588891.1 hypothetical protein [Lactococcus lactis]MDN6755666.1 hypothetical protein [Lactococcus lactis]